MRYPAFPVVRPVRATNRLCMTLVTHQWENAWVGGPPQLQDDRHWRMAVWSLRVGYIGLTVAIAGLVVVLLGSTPWVVAVGMIIWLPAAAVTLVGFLWSRRALPEPRPGFWSTRLTLIHDSVHTRSLAQRS